MILLLCNQLPLSEQTSFQILLVAGWTGRLQKRCLHSTRQQL